MIYTFGIDKNDGNGLIPLNNVFTGFSSVEILNEELDSGLISLISNESKSLPTMSYVRMTIDNTSKDYYISKDEVELLGKEDKTYKHTIYLIEIEKKLEKYLNFTLSFTQPQGIGDKYYYLIDCIDRIIRVCPLGEDIITNTWTYSNDLKREDNSYYNSLNIPTSPFERPITYVDARLRDSLKGIVAPQFIFQNLTLRELLDGILSYVNAISKLESINEEREMLGATFFNTLLNIINSFNEDEESTELSIEEYATQIESNAQNQICESNSQKSSIVYPTENSFDFLKSRDSEYLVTDTNAGVLVSYPIYKVEKVEILADIIIKRGADIIKSLTNVVIPIDEFCVEDTQYYNLEELPKPATAYNLYDCKLKSTCLHYSQFDNFISFSSSYKQFIFSSACCSGALLMSGIEYCLKNNELPENILQESSTAIFVSAIVHDSYGNRDTDFGGSCNIYNNTSDNIKIDGISLDTTFRPIYDKARVFYTSSINSNICSQKQDTEDVNCYSSSQNNQQERLISFENFSNNIWSLAQREGTQNRSISVRHLKASDLFKLGDYTSNREVITKAEYIYFNNYILGNYELSKDYNRINEFIGLNSKIRQYQMPTGKESYERILKISSFCEIGDSNSVDTLSYLTSQGINCFMSTLFKTGRDIYTKINSVIYTTLDNEWQSYVTNLDINSSTRYNNLLLECSTNGGGNTIELAFGFNNNISCGNAKRVSSSKYLKQPIAYCKPSGTNIGFLRNCKIYAVNKDFVTNSEILPLCEEPTLQPVYIQTPNMLILKDPSEILRFNFELPIIPNNSNIIVGRKLSSNNRLITNQKEDIYIYVSDKKYSKYDNLNITENITSDILLEDKATLEIDAFKGMVTFNTDYLNSISGKTLILANSNKEIYLCINLDYLKDKKTIYFNFVPKRSKINYKY